MLLMLQYFGVFLWFQVLIKAFLPNLRSPSASCRRTAAACLTLICQYSRNPPAFIKFLLVSLLGKYLSLITSTSNVYQYMFYHCLPTFLEDKFWFDNEQNANFYIVMPCHL